MGTIKINHDPQRYLHLIGAGSMTNKINLKLNITFREPMTVFALNIHQGWTPACFTSTPFILVDRNVVEILRQIGRTTDRGDHSSNKWWLSFLSSPLYTLNPLLCAMEGGTQTTPSLQQFIFEYESACRLLQEKIPAAKLITHSKESYEGTYRLIEYLRSRNTAEINFLINTVPLIAEKTSTRRIKRIEDKIIDEAQKNSLPGFSLALIAILSCLYDSNGSPRVGKGVVKPSKKYTDKNAYNTISDLRCLEALIAMCAFTNDCVSFLTRDKSLARFWTAIKPSNHKLTNTLSFEISLNTELLPRYKEDELPGLARKLSDLTCKHKL